MGLKEVLRGKHVYIDANIFIDILGICDSDLTSAYSDLGDLMDKKAFKITCSEFIYLEVLPYTDDKWDINKEQYVMEFLDSFDTVPFPKKILTDARRLRGETGMKSPDTLHVMTAVHLKCDIFLSNDRRIKVPDGLELVSLWDYPNKPSKDLESNPNSKQKNNSLKEESEKAKMEKIQKYRKNIEEYVKSSSLKIKL